MTVTPINDSFWQVSGDTGVLAYIDRITVLDEIRFRVRKLRYPDAKWVRLGEYWEFERAVEACGD